MFGNFSSHQMIVFVRIHFQGDQSNGVLNTFAGLSKFEAAYAFNAYTCRRLGAEGSYLTLVRVADRIL